MRYWEDFQPGEVERFGAYCVDAAEIAGFAGRFAASAARDNVAPPMLVCAVFMRLLVDHLLADSASMGSPGVDAIDWHAPVQAGDVLSVDMKLVSTRVLASRTDLGLLKHRAAVRNQHHELVAELMCNALFRRREAAP